MLRVTDGRGLSQHCVTIQDHMPELVVRLPQRKSGRGGARSGTVSVMELMHPLKQWRDRAAPRRTSAGDIGTCCCRTHRSGLLPPSGGTTCVASTAYIVLVTPRQMANGMPILVRHRDAVQYRYS